ncbi:putative Fe-S cluster assembly protein SufT [Photobacterium sp.]|uniref:putative Fe-S cluster assembly protein SufT n=1 Tax=Photobacterium sp. TaxID=660 RepID=UPI00299D3FDE|nr:putative Fe-S cluster assembly protein SufT [Photobacterium sp.]MDX1303116.1 putative Fe-S cluster assembly protein SufT [Photobacterium sp.]
MQKDFEVATVLRDCDAIVIPSGTPVTLPAHCRVVIIQELGGSFTVNENGRLLRIADKDADALGKKATASVALNRETDTSSEVDLSLVMDQLKTCYDPEIPVNIVDLGLIYTLDHSLLIDGRQMVSITMTLTAFGCGMGPVLVEDIREKVLRVPGVDLVDVRIVYDPPWSVDMMSDAAKLALGLL